MTNFSLKFPLLTLTTLAALAGCGGSDSATGSSPNGQASCLDAGAGKCTPVTPGPGSGFGGFGAFGGTSNGSAATQGGGGVGGPPPGPNCNDGQINPGESCDGTNLAGGTCATATMGSMPGGTLSCLSNCTYNVTGCTSTGPGGGTGGTGTGGNTGTGGATGTGGRRGGGGGGGP